MVKGVHLVLPGIPGLKDAFLLTAPQDGRVFFVIPWYGRTLIGTTETAVTDPSEAVVTPTDTRYLIDATRALMPELAFTPEQVIGCFAGVRTLQAEDVTSLSAVSREFVVTEPRPGLVMPIGGKYTTARIDAVEIVDAVLARLDRKPVASTTDRFPLPGAPMEDARLGEFTGWQVEAIAGLEHKDISKHPAFYLTLRHGTRVSRIIELIAEQPAWREPVHPEAPFLKAEVVLAVRDEMARTTEDVYRRRMPLSLLVPDDSRWREEVAELMRSAIR